MEMKILIASATKPIEGTTPEKLYAMIQHVAHEHYNVLVIGGRWQPGPGCNNMGFKLVGKKSACNEFGKALCLALMPAKWCETPSEIADGFTSCIES